MGIPRFISKNNHKYVFEKKCNDNMFLYRDINNGYKECFTKYDLKMVKPVNIDKVGWENEKIFRNYLNKNKIEKITYGEYLEREEEYKEATSE